MMPDDKAQREEERKRLAIDRQIDAIVGRMAVSKEDRARLTGMLHYMNLGAGRGQRWNAEQYARHTGDALANVERCYRLLRKFIGRSPPTGRANYSPPVRPGRRRWSRGCTNPVTPTCTPCAGC